MREIIGFHVERDENGYLSNWYPSHFTLDGVEFSSMEQYMMYKKAVIFGDTENAKTIMESDDPAKIKAAGRRVTGYNDHLWNGIRQIVVYEGLMAKFAQNADLREKLLGTGTALLAEFAGTDPVWGIGLNTFNPDRYDTSKWRGRNLLGYTLMIVREKLRNGEMNNR